jgi:cell division transport system permease protein
MLSLLRIIKFALQDIIRNLGLSFMTVLILVLMLLSVNTLLVINVLTEKAAAAIKDQIDISVYFSVGAADKNVNEIVEYVKSFPEVVKVDFLSREQVLAKFREAHQDNIEILASLDELAGNPFGPTMIIKTREPGDYAKITQILSVPEYNNIIESKTFGDTEVAINRIHSITTQVERFAAAVSALFAIIAFLIIFNTIRVAIYTQRLEISIKKLVGATNWFVRGPYVFEALFFTIISVGSTCGLVYLAFHFLEPYVAVIFQSPSILTNYYNSHIILLLSIQFLAVFILTIFSSFLAMRRHLRV